MNFPAVHCTDAVHGELSSLLAIQAVMCNFLKENSFHHWYCQTEWMFALELLAGWLDKGEAVQVA